MAAADTASTGKRADMKPQDSVTRLYGVWGLGIGKAFNFRLGHPDAAQSPETFLSGTGQKCARSVVKSRESHLEKVFDTKNCFIFSAHFFYNKI